MMNSAHESTRLLNEPHFGQNSDGSHTETVYFLDPNAYNQQLAEVPPQAQLNAAVMYRPHFAHLQVQMDGKVPVVANASTMLWQDADLEVDTSCHTGGMGDGCCRKLAGQSCCQNKYSGHGEVAFGFDLPGDILPFAVTPESGWILSQGSFICGSENIVVSGRFSGCSMCCCSGEGLFITHVTVPAGAGLFYAGDYGAIQRHEVPAGRNFYVDQGLFFACSDNTKIDVCMIGPCKTCLCGSEGFVMKFTGPCAVYTQNRDPSVIKGLLSPAFDASGAAGAQQNTTANAAGGGM